MTQSFTLALLPVLPSTYEDIRQRLAATGYDEALYPTGQIDMTGLALMVREEPERDKLDVYKNAKAGRYKAAIAEGQPGWSVEVSRVTEDFKRDALLHVGLHDHPHKDAIYEFALRVGEGGDPLVILWTLERLASFIR
jgi:hypothetical protein